MQRTVTEHLVSESGRHGGLIFEEMTRQWEGNDLDSFLGVNESKSKNNNSVLAFQVLQMEFLGFTGFVIPFAHFPTVGVQAHHLVV